MPSCRPATVILHFEQRLFAAGTRVTWTMRTHRFFLAPGSINEKQALVSIAEPGQVRQIKSVLRLSRGDAVVVLDGQGQLYRCTLKAFLPGKIEAAITGKEKAGGQSPFFVTVALPLLKGGRFEWAIEKITELGAGAVAPFISSRSVVKPGAGSGAGKRLAHWQAIMLQAAEQCERATVPAITEPVAFDVLMTSLKSAQEASIICAERSQAPPLKDWLHRHVESGGRPANITLIVGPEGGFTAEELQLAAGCGASPVVLGERILRSETAALCALAQILS